MIPFNNKLLIRSHEEFEHLRY